MKSSHYKRPFAVLLVMMMLVSSLVAIPVASASTDQTDQQAAQFLFDLGLFLGVGDNPDGTPNFDLGRTPTRAEALVMDIRLFGVEEEAFALYEEGDYGHPFDDVPDWAAAYVAHGYNTGITMGVSDTAYGSSSQVTAAQYLTFILRALGYEDGTDFEWNEAWKLTDEAGITFGEFSKEKNSINRGAMARVSLFALVAENQATGNMLIKDLAGAGAIKEAALEKLDEIIEAIKELIANFEVPTYEWWDLRGYEEQEYDSAVESVNSDFAGKRVLSGTYDGSPLVVTHYWGWYAETPNSMRQRIDIYVPSHATSESPVLHMVNNAGWVMNAYPFNAPVFDAETGVFTPGNNTSANALNRGYIVMTNGARTYGAPTGEISDLGKAPATMSDYKSALRFLRANMGPDKEITVGNPGWVFVTGGSGGGAMSDILGASGNSPDFFATMYDIGTLGLDWVGTTEFGSATLAQKTDGANWKSALSDAYLGVAAWCPMDDFPMGEQAMAWFFAGKRWEQDDEAAKTPAMMNATNRLAAEFVQYITALGLKDEDGKLLAATYTNKTNPDEGGIAGGSFHDATVRLLEKGIERAINQWATETNTDSDAAVFAVADSLEALYSHPGTTDMQGTVTPHPYPTYIRDSILINGEAVAGPVTADTYPVNPTVEITDLAKYLIGLNASLAKGSVFPYSSGNDATTPGGGPASGVTPFEPGAWAMLSDTSGMYGADDQPNNVLNREAWNSFIGPAADFPGAGKANSGGQEWDDYLKTPAGQTHAMQLKMASSIPYLNAWNDAFEGIPHLVTAGITGSGEANPAKYWFVRYGMNDQQISYAMLTTLYYSLMNNPAVDFDNCEVIPFNWNKPHTAGYENIFTYIDGVVAIEAALAG